MTARLITPSAALAVSLASAKLNLRIDNSDSDAIITAWIQGITTHAEHITGRSFINQTWRVTLDAFPDAIELPCPVSSVTSVKYLDALGIEQTLAANQYFVDTVSEPGQIVPAAGVTWPDTLDRINAVYVDVVAGYGATDASVPDLIKLYILAKLTEQFDPSVRMEKDTVQASFLDRLLDRFKVYSL